MTILTVGIDLAKNVFAVHGVNEAGKAELVRPAVPRDKLHELIASLPPCLIGEIDHLSACRVGDHEDVGVEFSRHLGEWFCCNEDRVGGSHCRRLTSVVLRRRNPLDSRSSVRRSGGVRRLEDELIGVIDHHLPVPVNLLDERLDVLIHGDAVKNEASI